MTDQAQALTQDEKNMGIVVHVASFAGYIIPFGSILGPLIVWLMQRDEINTNQYKKVIYSELFLAN